MVAYRNTNRLDQANANATWANTVASAMSPTNWDILSVTNLSGIDAARGASIRDSNLTRIDDPSSTNDVAGEMDKRGAAQGDSLINQRTSYGGAQVTLATTLDGVEDGDDAVSQSLAAMSRSSEMSEWSNRPGGTAGLPSSADCGAMA